MVWGLRIDLMVMHNPNVVIYLDTEYNVNTVFRIKAEIKSLLLFRPWAKG